MRKAILFITICSSFFFYSCKKEDPVKAENLVVNNFIYDGLSQYYLWADEMKSKKPTVVSPETYFESVLSQTDKDHGWSFLTDDVPALLAQFSGTPKDFGYELFVYWADIEKTHVVGVVKYVYPNTPAANAGITRGNVITKINGADITEANYQLLFGQSSINITVTDQNKQNPKEVNITPTQITTNPVYYTNVYTDIASGKKIAYLFYTGFIDDFNNSLFDAFSTFKQSGVTDLVLDLRYNHGGSLTAAKYLAALIMPRTYVENKAVLTVLSFNDYLNKAFDELYNNPPAGRNKEDFDRKDYLGSYGTNEKNPLDANLNLNKVYIIATDDSYSASELTTFCLRPFMEVVHIGSKTGGKYTASWTIHPYDGSIAVPVYEESKMTVANKNTLKNWAMQPIVAKYTDKDGKSFESPGYLAPNELIASQERNTATWKPIGDETDYLLAKAISMITGKPYQAPRRVAPSYIKSNILSPFDELKTQSVFIKKPKLTTKDWEEIRKLLRN